MKKTVLVSVVILILVIIIFFPHLWWVAVAVVAIGVIFLVIMIFFFKALSQDEAFVKNSPTTVYLLDLVDDARVEELGREVERIRNGEDYGNYRDGGLFFLLSNEIAGKIQINKLGQDSQSLAEWKDIFAGMSDEVTTYLGLISGASEKVSKMEKLYVTSKMVVTRKQLTAIE